MRIAIFGDIVDEMFSFKINAFEYVPEEVNSEETMKEYVSKKHDGSQIAIAFAVEIKDDENVAHVNTLSTGDDKYNDLDNNKSFVDVRDQVVQYVYTYARLIENVNVSLKNLADHTKIFAKSVVDVADYYDIKKSECDKINTFLKTSSDATIDVVNYVSEFLKNSPVGTTVKGMNEPKETKEEEVVVPEVVEDTKTE